MSATVTFEPLPDSKHQFESISIDLHGRDQVYVIGFPRHSLVPTPSSSSSLDSPSASECDSECTRDGDHYHRGRSVRRSNKAAKDTSKTKSGIVVNELAFSNELVEDKLCVVPADPDIPLKMRFVFAAIWLAPGYKVMILPSGGTKIYYQRAIPGNPMWRRINQGYGVELSDRFMTVLDKGIHIKIDARPNKHSHNMHGRELLRRVLRYLRRSASTMRSSSQQPTSRASTFPLHPHPLVRQIHTEIEGTERHDGVRPYQIAACVRVSWADGLGENMRFEPEKGLLETLRKEREEKWREKEEEDKERAERQVEMMDEKDIDKMEVEANPFLDDAKGMKENYQKKEDAISAGASSPATSTPSVNATQEVERGRARERALPPIPEAEHEHEHEHEQEIAQASKTPLAINSSPRPSRPQRTKSNTTRLPSRPRDSLPERGSRSQSKVEFKGFKEPEDYSLKSTRSKESNGRSSERRSDRAASPRRVASRSM
ncbi:hypothetical protein A7U60_g3216 [Sanghuangporus baumii]|uniref:Uncharacterized protein n=1 Tax=Sanghuangporus baumii TaxID=108892 RepID=A0A9Q5I0W7_SANBA|nr:hypothetical protein A7U60_g3216 [Sanghuangporus baumii]